MLIILINLLAAVMIPLCPAIVFISNSKVSFSTFALTKCQWLWNMCSFCGQAKESKPKAESQAKLTKVSSLLDNSRQVNALLSALPTSPPSLRPPLPPTRIQILHESSSASDMSSMTGKASPTPFPTMFKEIKTK